MLESKYDTGSQRNHWAWMANRYDKQYSLYTKSACVKMDRKANLMMALTGTREGKKVLEIGFGTGLFTKRFAVSGADITAIDISPEMYEITKKLNLNVKLKLCDAYNTGLPDGSFDIVLGAYILQWTDHKRILGETYRLLKKGGMASFLLDNLLNPLVYTKRVVNMIHSLFLDKIYPSFIMPKKLYNEIKECGFKVNEFSSLEFVNNRHLNTLFELLPGINKLGGSLIVVITK